jgi:NTE family protein
VCLVLGSGGIKATSAVGLLRALEEQCVVVDEVVASSAGSIIGALFAKGLSVDAIEHLVLKHWKNSAFLDLDAEFLYSLIKGAFGVCASPKSLPIGIVKGSRIERTLETVLEGAEFEDLKIPFSVIAFDAYSGEQVVIRKGRVHQAVRASISLPMLFRPMRLNGRVLIDGGMANPLPIDQGFSLGADLVIAMGFDSPTRGSAGSALGFAVNSVNLAIKSLFEQLWSRNASDLERRSIIIRLCLDNRIRFFETSKIPLAIEFGYEHSRSRIHAAKSEGLFAARQHEVEPEPCRVS